MVQHIVSMKSTSIINNLNNFMGFCVMMDVLLIVLNNLNLIIVPIFIILIRLSSNYGINDKIFTNSNISNACQKHGEEQFVDELSVSVIIDNTSGMTSARFGNSTKQFFIACKATSGAAHSAHANNLNANYFNVRNDRFANYCINTSMCSKVFFAAKIDTIVDWNEIIAMLNQLLTITMKTEAIFSSLPVTMICEPRGNPAVLKEYNTQRFDLCDTPLANVYYRNEIKDNFEATITEASFEQHSITLRREARIECPQNTDVVFNTLFGNTTTRVAGNETKSGHYDCFDTIMIILTHVDAYVFLLLKKCVDRPFC